MQYIKTDLFNKLIADKGKVLRAVDDVYVESHIDEDGNKVEEHIPCTTNEAFLPKNITEEQAKEMYVEEEKEQGDA